MSFTRSWSWVWWILGGLLMVLGLAVRLYDLPQPPLDFHPTRQLHSLIMARGYFYQDTTNVPDWQRKRAVEQGRQAGIIEPPLMEHLAAYTYQLAGKEIPWVGRVYSILFWMVGGIGLALLANQFFSPPAVLVALGFYLVLPYGIYASRSFQPDSLMVALMIFAVWAFVRWLREYTWVWAIAAGFLGGAAILVKGVAVFQLGMIWMLGIVWVIGLRYAIKDMKVWTILILTLLPYIAYTAWGLSFGSEVQGQFSLRFFPVYWIQPAFYLRWYQQLLTVFGLPCFITALLGLLWLPDRKSRVVVWGAWMGYILMGMSLAHHIATHDYYSLPMIPFAGLGIAALAQTLFGVLPEPRRLVGPLVTILLLWGAVMSAWQAYQTIKHLDYQKEVVFWRSLSDKLGLDAQLVALTPDYGYRLQYWGWLTPSNWLTAADATVREDSGQSIDLPTLLRRQTAGKDFFLVTMMDELDRQPEIKKALSDHYPIFASGPGWVIYDLRSPRGEKSG